MPLVRSRSLLVVDDDLAIRRALVRTLRDEPYEVIAAADAGEALELLRKRPIDLVLSDHLMPGMTGLELLALVRDRHPDTLRLMLTGHADTQVAIDAINQGEIYRFLQKPWDDTELKVTLQLAFDQLELERENRRLIALVQQQRQQLKRLEARHPGISRIQRDESGAIVLDESMLADA